MVEFGLDFEKPGGQDILSPPKGRIYIAGLPDEDEEKKLYITEDKLEPLDLSTYIDLMTVNLKRLKKQAKKRLAAYRRNAR
jgi:hypothetical protein